MEPKIHYAIPATTRSILVLEVASQLVRMEAWPYRQARISLRKQGDDGWKVCLFGSDNPDAIDEVARGDVHVALINPAAPLTLAVRGTGPFREPIALRAIAVIPSLDQLGFAVAERTGLTSLTDIRDRRFPLRLSLRGQPHHSTHLIIKEALRQVGFSLDDIVAWGGEVRYDTGIPYGLMESQLALALAGTHRAGIVEAIARLLAEQLQSVAKR